MSILKATKRILGEKSEIMGRKQRSITGASLSLKTIQPLTKNQEIVLESDKDLILYGAAGTGKTYISCYAALRDINEGEFDKLVIIRSAVSTRDIGFLPGTEKEKAAVYELPYKDIAIHLFRRGDAYEILKSTGVVEFMTTSFIRGTTLTNAVILIDECQNMSFHELDSIITRMGHNCRVIFCGDFQQSDLNNNGLQDFLNILEKMQEFALVKFETDDIVRSGLVKNYIIAKEHFMDKKRRAFETKRNLRGF